jgi:WD40 repeat protein
MIRVWDLQTGEPVLGPLAGHDGGVSTVAAGRRDGRLVIASGGFDRTVRVWTWSQSLTPPCGSSSSIGWCQSPAPVTD